MLDFSIQWFWVEDPLINTKNVALLMHNMEFRWDRISKEIYLVVSNQTQKWVNWGKVSFALLWIHVWAACSLYFITSRAEEGQGSFRFPVCVLMLWLGWTLRDENRAHPVTLQSFCKLTWVEAQDKWLKKTKPNKEITFLVSKKEHPLWKK